jgi:hypothetical protein
MGRFFYDHDFALVKEVGCMQVEIVVMQLVNCHKNSFLSGSSSPPDANVFTAIPSSFFLLLAAKPLRRFKISS